jgi:hypothetical protein
MQRGGLASNPRAQWCLAVTKPALQHGFESLRFFHWWPQVREYWQDPVYENVSIFRPLKPSLLRCLNQTRQ